MLLPKPLQLIAAFLLASEAVAWDHDAYLTSPDPNEIPSPNADGTDWENAFAKASDFVSELSLQEKVDLVSGTEGPCVGNIAPVYRLNFTGLCIQNGPLALEQGTYTSVFSAGVSVAASWDKKIAYLRGLHMAEEFKGKGAHVLLGPVAGPLGRAALGGRNWEGFSPDPYLTGDLFTETIQGIQDGGVQASAKHFIGNEQETQRNPTVNAENKTIESVSSNIDDRTLHELYLWPFAQAVKAGVASIMCSYNRLNQTYGCQNSKVLNGILKGELGFQGYVMSDWGATHSGALAVNAGEDMDMPGTSDGWEVHWHHHITDGINNGSIAMDRLDDMCRRIMAPYYQLKQDQGFPAIDPVNKDLNSLIFTTPDKYKFNFTYQDSANVDVRKDHAAAIREAGAAGTVLLKNVNNTLPLRSTERLGVFGNDAGDYTNGMSYFFFNGVSKYEYGTLATGGGSGSGLFSYVVSPLEAIKQKADFKKNLVSYILNNTAIIEPNSPYLNALIPFPDTCIVFLKSWATEGEDRTTFSSDWEGDKVVNRIASKCSKTIVVLHSNGINVMPWANHPNVTAILAAHLPGEETGNSIVDILWGDINPSGRLPFTIAKSEADYRFAPITNSTALLETQDPYAWQSDFKEGVLIDYRHFDYYNKSVQYEFGYGLSYTTFDMSKDLQVNSELDGKISALPAADEVVPGGNPRLWDVLYKASVMVKNTGKVAGAVVPQLYLSVPRGSAEGFIAKSQLRGFEKVHLTPGQSTTVEFNLTRRDLSYWDTVQQNWVIPQGRFQVHTGFSSRDFRASASFAPLG